MGNNLIAIAIPYSALSMPLALLLLMAAFEALPNDLEDAAKLEGLSLWQRLRWVLLPLIAPASASTSILVFLFAWNEYPVALTWLSRSDLLTLPVAMARITCHRSVRHQFMSHRSRGLNRPTLFSSNVPARISAVSSRNPASITVAL